MASLSICQPTGSEEAELSESKVKELLSAESNT